MYKGKVWTVGNDVDTDVIIAARYLNDASDENMRKICFKILIIIFCFMLAISIDTYAITNTKNEANEENMAETTLIEIKEKERTVIDEYKEKYSSEKTGTIAYWLYKINLYSYLFSIVIWITCIVSLVLNCIRKNVGKAVFSGVGLIVPFIAMFFYSLGKMEYAINEDGISVAIFLLALILEVIVEILAFIFCFSKSKIGKEI